jgi:hypothetical protein
MAMVGRIPGLWHIPKEKKIFARNACCTVTIELLVWHSNPQKTSPPEWPFSHYIHLHCLAAEMWTTMKNNLLGKKILSCSFCL